MANIKITLTEWQAWEIIDALEKDINPDFGARDPFNRRIQRIVDKITNAATEAEEGNTTDENPHECQTLEAERLRVSRD